MSIAKWLGQIAERPPVDPTTIRALREELETHAAAAVEMLAPHVPEPLEPGHLRLPKSRLVALERCERSALAMAADEDDDTLDARLLRGVAYDRFVMHQLHAGRVLDPIGDLRSILTAEGEWSTLAALDRMEEDDPRALAELLEPVATAVADGWAGIDAGWLPRTQSRATVTLARSRVVCSGAVDVQLGGRPTDRPAVLIEVKSADPRNEHIGEVAYYALLVALRDGTAPGHVVRWYPGTPPADLAVTEGLLESACRRVVAGLRLWAELRAGRRPEEQPGPWCNWCPDSGTCPSSAAEDADRDGVGAP